jgi:hypothetical protein
LDRMMVAAGKDMSIPMRRTTTENSSQSGWTGRRPKGGRDKEKGEGGYVPNGMIRIATNICAQ